MKKRGKTGTRVLILNNYKKITKSKRSQLQVSFGMIFSVFLIIAFIAVAIYAIVMFLGIKKCAETGEFKNNLQEEINRAWNSDETSSVFKESLNTDIQQVCFIDLSEEARGEYKDAYNQIKKLGFVDINMFFYPLKNACQGGKAFLISHLNISEITKQNNPNCFGNIKGKVEIKIEKGFHESLVRLS